MPDFCWNPSQKVKLFPSNREAKHVTITINGTNVFKLDTESLLVQSLLVLVFIALLYSITVSFYRMSAKK